MPRPILIARCGFDSEGEALRAVVLAKESGFDLVGFPGHGVPPDSAARVHALGKRLRIPAFFSLDSPEGLDGLRRLDVGFVRIEGDRQRQSPLWIELAHADWKGTVFYSTTDPQAKGATGRVPLWEPTETPEGYEPFFAADEPIVGRIGVSLNSSDGDLWMRCWVEEAAAIESHVGFDFPELARFADMAGWIKEARSEVRHADPELDGQLDNERGVLERVPSIDRGHAKVKKWDIFKKRRRNRDRGGAEPRR